MINFTDIENTIIELDSLYTSATNTLHQILYSKLGILEYCGWLEESFDIIADEFIVRNIAISNHSYARNMAISKNHGFSYDNNIRPMLSKVMGFHILEFLENDLEADYGKFTLMKSYIDYFIPQRKVAAHQATSVTTIYDTPSIVLVKLRDLRPILSQFEANAIVVYP